MQQAYQRGRAEAITSFERQRTRIQSIKKENKVVFKTVRVEKSIEKNNSLLFYFLVAIEKI